MNDFRLFASPWWVNLFVLLPFVTFYLWYNKLNIQMRTLILTAIFGIAFGFTEAATVVYIRGSVGLLSAGIGLQQTDILVKMPQILLRTEITREVATLVILASVAFLSANTKRDRWAIFFWTLAIWDIIYYVSLRLLIGWPQTLTTPDVLFLIPMPWYSQVWWPIFISILLLISVYFGRAKNSHIKQVEQGTG